MSRLFRIVLEVFHLFGMHEFIDNIVSNDQIRVAVQYFKYFKFEVIVKSMPGSIKSRDGIPFDYCLQINILRTNATGTSPRNILQKVFFIPKETFSCPLHNDDENHIYNMWHLNPVPAENQHEIFLFFKEMFYLMKCQEKKRVNRMIYVQKRDTRRAALMRAAAERFTAK